MLSGLYKRKFNYIIGVLYHKCQYFVNNLSFDWISLTLLATFKSEISTSILKACLMLKTADSILFLFPVKCSLLCPFFGGKSSKSKAIENKKTFGPRQRTEISEADFYTYRRSQYYRSTSLHKYVIKFFFRTICKAYEMMYWNQIRVNFVA